MMTKYFPSILPLQVEDLRLQLDYKNEVESDLLKQRAALTAEKQRLVHTIHSTGLETEALRTHLSSLRRTEADLGEVSSEGSEEKPTMSRP